jgi:hypothetical protein
MEFRAWSVDSPLMVKKLINCIATPTPAEPAPKKRMRWDVKGFPDASEESLAALMKPDKTTAPVPCISSLKTGYRLRYLSRYLKALSVEKSYQSNTEPWVHAIFYLNPHLELNKKLRESGSHFTHQFVHEFGHLLLRNTFLPQPKIQRVIEVFLSIRPNIQADRNGGLRTNAISKDQLSPAAEIGSRRTLRPPRRATTFQLK